MTTYPIAMVASGLALQSFEPEWVTYQSPAAGGRVDAIAAGAPLWVAQWQTGKMGQARSDAIRAFKSRLRGGIRTFLGVDLARPFPMAYPNGFTGMTRASGGSFNGSATAWSQTIDGEGDATIRLNGLPVSFALGVGDYIGWKWDAAGAPGGSYQRRALCRVIVAATGNGSGVIDVMVEPPLNTLVVPVGAIAHLDKPCCVMRLLPDDSKLGPVDRRKAITSGTLTAVQDLRP